MKKLIKEILYAAHECGVCPDWGDKICEAILDILKRDGITIVNEDELEKLAEEYVKTWDIDSYESKLAFKAGYRKAVEE